MAKLHQFALTVKKRCSVTNPCAGVRGHKETGRDRYVENDEFLAVWKAAHYTVQDNLSHRPATSLLKFNRSDMRDGNLCLSQNKTSKALRIAIVGELKELLERILNREHRSMGGSALLQDGNGQRLTAGALRTRFDKARKAAGVSFQFRDIRAKTATNMEHKSYLATSPGR